MTLTFESIWHEEKRARELRSKIKNKGRKSLTEEERKEAVSLGVIK
tara:strand:+ start:2265 stop:2402 length:138 start_codon:yes stop_codon:yes gene_type:complete